MNKFKDFFGYKFCEQCGERRLWLNVVHLEGYGQLCDPHRRKLAWAEYEKDLQEKYKKLTEVKDSLDLIRHGQKLQEDYLVQCLALLFIENKELEAGKSGTDTLTEYVTKVQPLLKQAEDMWKKAHDEYKNMDICTYLKKYEADT